MLNTISREVTDWLLSNGMETMDIYPLQGRFRASLFSITVKNASGQIKDLICKISSNQGVEVHLYQGLLGAEPALAPSWLGTVQTQAGTALVLERFGRTLTETVTGLSAAGRMALVSKAAVKLAEMHGKLEHQVEAQRRGDILPTSLEAVAKPWRQMALDELRGLRDRSGLVNESDATIHLTDLCTIAQRWVDTAHNYYTDTNSRITVTHGDPHLGNWLVRGEELRMVDWEYAGLSVPQRDIAIFLQDIPNLKEQQTLYETYVHTLRKHGWDTDSKQFKKDYFIHFLDNTLMMLGWDIASYRAGTLDADVFWEMISTKSVWIRSSAAFVLSL
ncbi:phosphotransferase [Alicyclobacillus sp. SO9]|uniref:phosphotransferase n=1 Tax=Alicyclobacillus sp. SO9 TaxID=2665646 RepID=UPI0018E7F038|nr:phosphotransferase [Alicyclobacillus sp. SO9]